MSRRRSGLVAVAALALTTAFGAPAGAADGTDGGGQPAPSVLLEGGAVSWTAIRSGAPSSTAGSGFDGGRFAGQCVGEGGRGCPPDGAQRVAYDFGDLGDPAALQDGVVVAATLSAPVVQDQDCGVREVTVHRAPAVAADTTWENSADRWSSRLADASSEACGGERPLELDVTAGVERAVRAGAPLAFGLAGDEDCRGCGRASFGPAARLAVELRSPDVVEPTGLSVGASTWDCASGEDRPAVRSATPRLEAVLSNDREPFPTSMSAVFAVRDLTTGVEVWRSEPTTPRGSGTTHRRAVPAGVLEHGGTYSWTAQAVLPSGNLTKPVGCELTVDTQAPGAPTVTAVDGYPAVYGEDAVSGGIGETGGFRLAAPDAVTVRYSFGSDGMGERARPGDVVEFTPAEAGSHVLYAQAVDAAGNVGPRVGYRFGVAFPVPSGGTWHFDELAGLQSANSLDGGPSLTLSGEHVWGLGPLGDLAGDPSDGALVLDGPGDLAATDEVVVDPAEDLTVAALVKPAAEGATADVLSQGGTAGFALGTVAGESCASSTGTCWSFGVGEGDGSSRATVVSDAAPVPGEWAFVAGRREAATGDVDLWVCALTEAGGPQRVGSVTAAPLTADPAGRLAVGGGAWQGTVDGVRVLDSLHSESDLRRWCYGGR